MRRLFRRPGGLMVAALFVVIGAAFLTQVVPYRQIAEANQRVDDARRYLAELEADNQRLAGEAIALETEVEIERRAREQLGYVRPGETAFVVVDPPESERKPGPPPVVDDVEDVRTWVDRIWDFITGADVESGHEPGE